MNKCVLLAQVVPVSASGVDVKDAFMDCAQMQNIELHDIPKHSDIKQVIYFVDIMLPKVCHVFMFLFTEIIMSVNLFNTVLISMLAILFI